MIFNFYDWDNTLVFSNVALFHSYRDAFAEYGIKIDFEYFMSSIFNDSTIFMRALGFDNSKITKTKKHKNELLLSKYFNEIEHNSTIEINNTINTRNFIVTNTNADLVSQILKKIKKQRSRTRLSITLEPEFIIGSESVQQRKPYPNLYHHAFNKIANDFDFDNDMVQIYEDSVEGLLAAARFFKEMKDGINGLQEIKNFKIINVK